MNPDWVEKDFYKVLGLDKSASADEIKKTYRKLAKELHPDANPDNAKAEARFKQVSEAYDVLGSDQTRSEYDQLREAVASGRFPGGAGGFPGGFQANINLDDLFGGGGMGDLFGVLFGVTAGYLRGWVERARHIRYTGYDTEGRRIVREAKGFHARVVQHECDHLEGILYPQRMRDMKKFMFESEIHYWLEKEKEEEPA